MLIFIQKKGELIGAALCRYIACLGRFDTFIFGRHNMGSAARNKKQETSISV
jgi:hypothetical protein